MMTLIVCLVLSGVLAGVVARNLRRRGLDRWLVPYVLDTPRRRNPAPDEPVHLLLCLADHFEPRWGLPSQKVALERVDYWVREYPRQLGDFRDSDGRPPRHTFFFPLEDYDPDHLDGLAELCRMGYGEVEVHLHHDRDTEAGLRSKLLEFKETLAQRHGLLSQRRDTGELAYGFIHGNWALCNSRPDGRWCGVNNELDVLRETGCYADFTLPSAPSPTQTRKINSIYYAWNDPSRSRSHDTGVDVGVWPPFSNALMLIQGPLVCNWNQRKWGVLPRVENACIQAGQIPHLERVKHWLRARVQIPSRPDWFFVKLHTHGAKEANRKVLLGPPMIAFHRALAQYAVDHPNFHFHYVTAREMFNLVKAAEAGWSNTVEDALDYELIWNGCASPALVS